MAMDARKMMVANNRVGSNMDLSCLRGPMRKRVDDRDMTLPIVYKVAKATMLTNKRKLA